MLTLSNCTKYIILT